MKNYLLQTSKEDNQKYLGKILSTFKAFELYLRGEKRYLFLALLMTLISSLAGVISPYLIAKVIDQNLISKNSTGLLEMCLILFLVFVISAIAGYLQGRIMGGVAQNTLYKIRTSLFKKLQDLPISFFNQNKTGDLMSRINNDTDKLNTFLSETVLRFLGNFALILGIGIFILFLNLQLAIVALVAAVVLFFITKILSPYVESLNKENLVDTGVLSSNVQESLNNFKVITAFNRLDYFEKKFQDINHTNFKSSLLAKISSDIFKPIYDTASYIAQFVVLIYGIHLIQTNQLTIGVLIGFLGYTQRFYEPLRILGSVWGSVQISTAAWSRVREILNIESDLKVISK